MKLVQTDSDHYRIVVRSNEGDSIGVTPKLMLEWLEEQHTSFYVLAGVDVPATREIFFIYRRV